MPSSYPQYVWTVGPGHNKAWDEYVKQQEARKRLQNLKEFQFGRVNPHYRYKFLDVWIDEQGKRHLIETMSKAALNKAIKRIEKGWKCKGQQAKLISLQKALAKRMGR